MSKGSAADCLGRVTDRFGHAVVVRCAESGCELRLDGLHNYVVLKGELLRQDRRMPDCILFKTNGAVVIGVVELKSRTVHVSEVVDKLTNGTRAALAVLDECFGSGTPHTFYHVVLSKTIAPSEHVIVTRRKVKVGKGQYDILPRRCGTSFASLLSL